jgi:hypothetical protein
MYISINVVLTMMLIITVAIISSSTVYAGGPRYDTSSDKPGAFDCWVDGFDDGANQSFDDDRDKECKNIDDQYSKGYEAGNRLCNDPNMLSEVVKDDCEQARDSPQHQSEEEDPVRSVECTTMADGIHCKKYGGEDIESNDDD